MTINQKISLLALGEFGHKEIVGRQDNPEIIKYFESIGFGNMHDETAWCSAFMNWVAGEAGAERTRKLNARSWLKVGKHVANPIAGDVVVLWRVARNDWRGHVGVFVRETRSWIYILGGNQGNQVKIQAYHKSRLLGYRRLQKS